MFWYGECVGLPTHFLLCLDEFWEKKTGRKASI